MERVFPYLAYNTRILKRKKETLYEKHTMVYINGDPNGENFTVRHKYIVSKKDNNSKDLRL